MTSDLFTGQATHGIYRRRGHIDDDVFRHCYVPVAKAIAEREHGVTLSEPRLIQDGITAIAEFEIMDKPAEGE